jgi:hypothetical protein
MDSISLSAALRVPGRDSVGAAQIRIEMKFSVMAVVLFLASVGSAGAQSLGGVPTVGGSAINNSGSINSSSSINTRSLGAPLDSTARAFKNVEATNPGEFVPSTFEDYDAAVNMGESARRFRPLTIVEAAHVAQKAKAAGAVKPGIILEQDAEGKLVFVQSAAQTNVQTNIQPNIRAKR